ncbi:uncharacterized protein JCM6883_007593 [Sporobolomyces salmoneus]|uniref:uncharacterized protein n=1 Tax=Sporobolomyces salmoneus TaxID=183962 RepID=UPI00316DA5AD
MQAVASASAGSLPPGEQHRRTPSNATSHNSPHHQSTSTSGAPAVRLPPVSIPREDFLPVAFNPERRQSINSDPFLHAFSATSTDPAYQRRPSIEDPSSLFNGTGGFQGPPQAGPNQEAVGRGAERGTTGMIQAAQPSSPRNVVSNAMPPPPHSFDSHANYQFGTSFASTSQHPIPHPHSSFPGPTSSYRFGGPSQNPPPVSLDPPSYYDYSMRRHSLSKNQSLTRYSAQGGGGGTPSNPSTKRKSSGEDDDPSFNDGSFYPNRDTSNYSATGMTGNPPPNSKRKTTSIAADKLNDLELDEGHRRESYSPTWEGRRASDESYRSNESQQGYSMFHAGQGGGGPATNPNQHQPPPGPPQPVHPAFPMRPPSVHQQFYDDQIGPRGSIARGMYEPEHQNFGRRPSIPSVSQMIQGQAPFYPGPAPHSAPPTAQHPPPNQPSVQIAQPPPEGQQGLSNGYPVGPPPQWPTSAPPPQGQASRQGSAGSLDPGSLSKDSPYSRSPELRISHKLAERKRRKEMAQLFDDLRESLPGDKGVKSSKWEILTKAVEFIGQLKAFNRDLQNDNQNLRHHLNLPQAQPPPHDSRPGSGNVPHPLQPAPRPVSSQQQPQQQQNPHTASPRPNPSRTGSHASSHTSSLSIDNGLPNN